MEITLKTSSVANNKRMATKQMEDYFNINTAIENLFDEVDHTVDWFEVDKKVGIQVTYTDFLSYNTIERMLRSIVPGNVKIILKRELSDMAVARFLMREYKKNDIGIVDCINGSLMVEPIRDFIRRKFVGVEVV